MPNVAKVLKEEIARISRKEAKAAIGPIRKPSVRLRRDVADLKSRMARMEQTVKGLQAMLSKVAATQPAVIPEGEKKARITAKGMRSLRRKLRLSQNEFATLIGISGQAVSHWEKQQGALRLRDATRAEILPLRDLGARDARKMLEAMKPKKATSKRGRRGKRK